MSSSAQPRLQLSPLRGAARSTFAKCKQQVTMLADNHRNLALAASSTALIVFVRAFRRRKTRSRQDANNSVGGASDHPGHELGASIDQQRGPCPVLWQQIQQRDWLFGLPPQIADAIIARLDVADLKSLRATCRQTYLQVAARTTKLILALDVSRTWRQASHRLDAIYPSLRHLHLILATDTDRPEHLSAGDPDRPLIGTGPPFEPPGSATAAAIRAGPGLGSLASSLANTVPTPRGRDGANTTGGGGGGDNRGWRGILRLGGRHCGGGDGVPDPFGSAATPPAGSLSASNWRRLAPSGPECLRGLLSWSASGHLHGLTLLDLSRCPTIPISRDTWAALVAALGPGDMTLRVAWRALLAHGMGGGGGGGGAGGNGGRWGGGRGAGSASGSGAGAAAASGSGSGGSSSSASGGGSTSSSSLTSPLSSLALPDVSQLPLSSLLPLAAAPSPPQPRCTCSICGPSPPDAAPVLAALQVLAGLRPACSVELEGRGLPMRSPAMLQQLCGVTQLASVSLAVCGVRPLAHHAGWFSCLRRLHTLELRYRDEPGGEGALQQILRALQAPVPLRSLLLHRPGSPPLDESDLAALAALPDLTSLTVPGLRVHSPTAVALPGLTRLALRSDRLELTQPLVTLFPGLQHLELGTGVEDLPPTGVLAAAAAARGMAAALAAAAPQPAAAGALLEEVMGLPQPQQQLEGADGAVDHFGAAAAGQHYPAVVHEAPSAWWHQQQQYHPYPPQLPAELTLHLRLLQGLSGLRVLCIGGKPGHGVEALSSLTALTSLSFVRCSEFRPLRKAVEELRGLTCLATLELHACLGGDGCGYEIARLLRRLQKLPNLTRLVLQACDPRLPQQLATAPLGRLSELHLLGLPELHPLDLRYVLQAQTACRRLAVRGCGRLGCGLVRRMPAAVNRPALAVEWSP